MDEKILIVSASQKSSDALAHILKRYAWTNISFASSGVEARRLAMRTMFELIIINVPLKDEQGNSLAVDLINGTNSSVILIAKSDIVDMISSKVEGEGVVVVSKPLQQNVFLSSVRLSLAFSARIKKLIEVNMKFEKKYDELRIVSRAKCTLVEKEKLTEQEAHRFIEKQAMDRRESKTKVATDIVKKYM